MSDFASLRSIGLPHRSSTATTESRGGHQMPPLSQFLPYELCVDVLQHLPNTQLRHLARPHPAPDSDFFAPIVALCRKRFLSENLAVPPEPLTPADPKWMTLFDRLFEPVGDHHARVMTPSFSSPVSSFWERWNEQLAPSHQHFGRQIPGRPAPRDTSCGLAARGIGMANEVQFCRGYNFFLDKARIDALLWQRRFDEALVFVRQFDLSWQSQPAGSAPKTVAFELMLAAIDVGCSPLVDELLARKDASSGPESPFSSADLLFYALSAFDFPTAEKLASLTTPACRDASFSMRLYDLAQEAWSCRFELSLRNIQPEDPSRLLAFFTRHKLAPAAQKWLAARL